jgi:hypothetical protein
MYFREVHLKIAESYVDERKVKPFSGNLLSVFAILNFIQALSVLKHDSVG